MAYSIVTSNKQGANDGFTTSSFDSTGSDFGIVCVTSLTTPRGLSDNKGITWNALTASLSPVFSRSCHLFYAWNIGGAVGTGHTLTVTGTDEFIGLSWAFYSGSLTSSDPLGGTQGSGGVASGTSFAISSVTPSEDNCLVVAGCMNDNSAGTSINGGFTIRQSLQGSGGVHLGSHLADLIQTTAAAAGPTWSWTTSENGSGASAWFKAAGAVATVSVDMWAPHAHLTNRPKPMAIPSGFTPPHRVS